MKKIKIFLPVLMALVMLLSIPFAAACKNKKKEPPKGPGVYLSDIRIDYSNAKTLYDLGEEFSSAGLVVTAIMSDETQKDVTSNVTIDSTAYKKDVEGDYVIRISYEENSVIKNASYTVTVAMKVEYDGLNIHFANDYSDTVVLEDVSTASIDLTKIIVNEINEDGTEGGVVTPDSVKVYSGTTEKTATENVVSGLSEGVYQIVVQKPSDRHQDYMRKGMCNFYVVDNLKSISLNAEAQKEQPAGSTNVMKNTWVFTATYSSGKTDDVTAKVKYTPEIETKTEGVKSTTASYTEANVKDETITKTVDISYTITASTGTVTESWLVSDTVQDPEPEINAGTAIEDNSLFKITAEAKVKYSIGKNETDGVGNTSKPVTVSLQDGNQHTFKRGIVQSSDTDGSSDSGSTGNNSSKFIITAKQDITLKLYMVFTNSSFNSDREYTFTYQINGQAATTTTRYKKREEVDKLPEISLKAEDVLTIYATNYAYKSQDGADVQQAGRMWLFGAEATGTSAAAESTTYTYDFSELQAKVLERVKALPQNQNPNNNNEPYYTEDTLGDKIQLEASDFEGTKNGFITFLSAGTSKSTQYRTSSGGCIEIKGDRLQFTLTKPGTVTVIFSSTGTNADSDSDIALKDASGNYMTSNGTPATDNGYYTAHGTGQVTITFVVSQAGTYTLTTGTSTHDRAARIYGITVVDGTN